MQVSAVIVNWNSGPLLETCVRSLSADAPEWEVVVVDNASDDGSLAFASGPASPFLLLRNKDNQGFAAACNQGWRHCCGDLVLFLNPDTEALPGSPDRLAQTLQRESPVWAAGGRLINRDGTPQIGFNVRAFPTFGCVLAETLLLDEILPRNAWTRAHRMTDFDHASPRDVDQPAGACLMVRREVLEKLGGFDERFWPAWYEDVDLCKRIHDAGGRIVFVPDADFRHCGGHSLRRLGSGDFLHFLYANRIRYFAKHHGLQTARRVRALTLLGLRLRAILSLVCPLASDRSRRASFSVFRETARRIAAMPELLS